MVQELTSKELMRSYLPRSGRSKRTCNVVCVMCAFACFLLTSYVFASDNCGSLDRAETAIRLAQTVYPELKGREVSLQFSEGTGGPLSSATDVGSFLIGVDKQQWHPPTELGKRESMSGERGAIELPLYLQFGFIKGSVLGGTGQVIGRQLSCEPVEFMNTKTSQRMLEARKIVNAHPEWSDAQDLEAASKLGLMFGPDKKTAILKLLPLKGISSIYGPIQITEISFRTTIGSREPGSSFADLHWYVIAKTIGRVQKATMQLIVEPFNGKITAITFSDHRPDN